MKLTVKDINGQDQGELEIGFSLVENGKGTQAVHDAVVAYRAAQRSGTASTKTMGEVAGTGRKPWRQKGTGRARAGSFASPLWRGGGVVFGPKPRDFSKTLPRKAKKLALRKALSERLKSEEVDVVEALQLDDHKTKTVLGFLAKLNLKGTVLIVTDQVDRNLYLATRNLGKVEATTAESLNTYQVLRSDRLVFTRAALQKLEQRLKD